MLPFPIKIHLIKIFTRATPGISLVVSNKAYTVVHDFNGHEVNGKHGFNGKKCYDGGFYVVNNGKIDV